ncbi:unnamed protein product [Hyaloperonospora brassicae]|uniref:ATPase F1/V1/A1 complex alpha/beta subunit nucleotide-binding domain-containing protein n=1 Tax=Hyaloperonospora brassicae TaxID=162125 RepID=A0AAV0UUP5_HYABA|nr:unnamed protein product [Hyaloperonospora brassicae]
MIRVVRAPPRLAQRLSAATRAHGPCHTPPRLAPVLSAKPFSSARRWTTDDSETALAQQLMDWTTRATDDKADDIMNAQAASTVQAELPVNGVVVGVQNGLARVSGLRHAAIGSVVAVADAEGQFLCRGLVLCLEPKCAQVALLSVRDTAQAPVTNGLAVTLEHEQLEISGSVAAFAGAVLDPLGRALPDGADAAAAAAANDRVRVTWSAQSVPGVIVRAPLCSPFATGLLAIDCLRPMAHGHRFGVLGPVNSGKTRVALDVIAHQIALAKARHERPPHFVYVCIGKSAARVRQIRDALTVTGAMECTTIVAASDRDSLVLQYLAPFTGCAIAEYMMHNGNSRQSVVVYDDLATHTTVVEGLVQLLRLPRAAQISLSAHAVLMERSAQFRGKSETEVGPSLTSLVLVNALDSLEIPSEFQERVASLVDDFVGLETSLAQRRVFPPVDVLAPGPSVRGPPFQSATRWTFVSRLRARINAAAQVKHNVEVARKLGFETEPQDAERLEYLELVQQFFSQKPLLASMTPGSQGTAVTELEIELGVYFLTIVDVVQLPGSAGGEGTPLNLWEFLRDVVARLSRKESHDILQQLTTHPRTKAWTLDLQKNVASALCEELEAVKLRRVQGTAASRV